MKDLRLAQKGKPNERITEPTTVRDLAIIFKALEHAREQSRRSRNSPMKRQQQLRRDRVGSRQKAVIKKTASKRKA